jgi:S1-C subfamily serine protease
VSPALLLLAAAAFAGPKAPATRAAAPVAVEKSIVRLSNTAQRADWRVPWNPGRTSSGTGSGFVIEGGRIVTNAHVVSDSRNLVIHLHGDANPHPARIVALGHDCDLAIVEPVEPGLLDGLTPLRIGDMPAMGDEVTTLGYPAGGRWLSSTRGVVSRIDVIASVHSPGSNHLAIQTDAAINPGNSGGPVMGGGAVVGVAFQGIGSLENVGYFIPPPVIRHFLEDVADGNGYQGFPKLDVNLANMDAPAARRRAGLQDGETGVRVDFVHPGSPAAAVLQAGDILMRLDGEVLANDGTFAWGEQRLQLPAIIDRFQVGQSAEALVLRGGQRVSVRVPLGRSVYPDRPYETLPRYYVYGGLVFVPLDRETVAAVGGNDPAILYEYLYRQLEEPGAVRAGRVLLLRRLDHAVNAALPTSGGAIVDRVNGQPITSLESLIAAFESHTGKHQVIEFAHLEDVAVLDRAAAAAANAAILKEYAVPVDRRL